jgi:S-DNA-T family DNA segregation ATPase FtsK/SpoIIIE
MLLSTGNELIRIQCAFVDTPEVDKITEFIGNQRGYPEALILPEVPTEDGGELEVDDGERDSMFEEAARLVVQTQQGSTSLIQRKLKLGYNRAGRIVDQLESAGILGAFEGSKARRVLIPNEAALAAHLGQAMTGAGVGGF